jgi:hypothetical protein
MRRLRFFSVSLLLLSGMALAVQNPQRPQAAAQQAPTPKATIEGLVTRADNGQPLRGARVNLRRANNSGSNNTPRVALGADQSALVNALGINQSALLNAVGTLGTVTTDDKGHFLFSGVDPATYQISAEREGFIRSEYGQRTSTGRGVALPVAPNQAVKVELKMLQAGVVSGRVLAPDGLPASRATVQAYTYQYTGGQRTLAQVGAAQTNDLGDYRLFWLQPGSYFISVTSNETTEEGPVGAVDLSNSRGRGTAGAAAALQALTAVLGERNGAVAQGLGGAGSPPFYYPGTIDPAAAISVSVAAATETRGMDFRLQTVHAPTVSGRVVAPFPLDGAQAVGRGGRGAAGRGGLEALAQLASRGVQVSLNRVGGSRAGIGALLLFGSNPVNEDGGFEIKNVAPGDYNLTATGRDANGQEYTGRTRITVSNQDVANMVVTLRAGVEVRGKILLDGTPQQQFKMTNLRVSPSRKRIPLGDVGSLLAAAGGARGARGGILAGGAQSATAQVADDGSFTLSNVGAMEYRVLVSGLPQGAYVQAGRIESKDALNGPFTVDSSAALLQLQLGFSPGRVTAWFWTIARHRLLECRPCSSPMRVDAVAMTPISRRRRPKAARSPLAMFRPVDTNCSRGKTFRLARISIRTFYANMRIRDR